MALADDLRAHPERIVDLIDHTNVDPTATRSEIEEICEAVNEYEFCSAMIVPYHAEFAASRVNSSRIGAVVGFPYGTQNTAAKQKEVEGISEHVDEVDMVMNRTAFANGDDEAVVEDIAGVVDVSEHLTVKCIIESPALDRDEIRRAAQLAAEGGVDFVKTAVGYDGPTDPTEVKLIHDAVGSDVGVKASGGISTFEAALEMVEAGATRIGTSSGVDIMQSLP